MPDTMYSTASNSALISVRIPASFFLPMMISFGHFILQSMPENSLSALQTASPARGVIAETSDGAIFGLSRNENITLSSRLAVHCLPSLPLPETCSRAATTVPFSQPSAPSVLRYSFVEPTVSRTMIFLPMTFVCKSDLSEAEFRCFGDDSSL